MTITRRRKAQGAAGKLAWVTGMSALLLLGTSGSAMAAGLGDLANNVSGAFPAFVNLIVSGSYVAGMALAGAAILKFKAHKDNPTQVPLGTPIALLFIGAALLWLPSLISSTGETVFANDTEGSLSGPGSAWGDSE